MNKENQLKKYEALCGNKSFSHKNSKDANDSINENVSRNLKQKPPDNENCDNFSRNFSPKYC